MEVPLGPMSSELFAYAYCSAVTRRDFNSDMLHPERYILTQVAPQLLAKAQPESRAAAAARIGNFDKAVDVDDFSFPFASVLWFDVSSLAKFGAFGDCFRQMVGAGKGAGLNHFGTKGNACVNTRCQYAMCTKCGHLP